MKTFLDVMLWMLGGVLLSALILFVLWEIGWLT